MFIESRSNPALEAEIEASLSRADSLVSSYASWSARQRFGDTHWALLDDLMEFGNFRFETGSSCLALIRSGHIADALGLCRVMLENYLLLRLMTRGYRYFRLRDCSAMTPTEFAEFFEGQVAELEARRERGEENLALDVRKYPRAARTVMYTFEGLMAEDGDLKIPLHFFQFQEFRPETLRLKPQDYFQYYEPGDELAAAFKKHRSESTHLYRHYLSYDALLECLSLNDLADAAELKRIEAHYTFLGRFVHPTHNAARDLHVSANVHSGGTGVGIPQPYAPAARLLASTYVGFLLAGFAEELCVSLESAPTKYVSDPGTTELRNALQAAQAVRYFWFLRNDASDHDKFNWAVHHATDEELALAGGYIGLDSRQISFNESIYASFQAGLSGWRNARVGVYVPPLTTGLGA